MPTLVINKAEKTTRTVSDLVVSGVTFYGYKTPEWYMEFPCKESYSTVSNTIEYTTGTFDAGTYTANFYITHSADITNIENNSFEKYLLTSTTFSTNSTLSHTFDIDGSSFHPSDTYYLFCQVLDGSDVILTSAFTKVTVSPPNFVAKYDSGAIFGSYSGITARDLYKELLVSESTLGFVPKFIILDINHETTRTNETVFPIVSSYTRCYITYDQYTNSFKCLSLYNGMTAPANTANRTYSYLDDNSIYIDTISGTTFTTRKLDLTYIKGKGIYISKNVQADPVKNFVYSYTAFGGFTFKANIVQALASQTQIDFGFDPQSVIVTGGHSIVDGTDPKLSINTGNRIYSYGTLARTDGNSRTVCYANGFGYNRAYNNSSTETTLLAYVSSTDADYKIQFASYSDNKINVTNTNSSFNTYVVNYIGIYTGFQNVQNINETIGTAATSKTTSFAQDSLISLHSTNYKDVNPLNTTSGATTVNSFCFASLMNSFNSNLLYNSRYIDSGYEVESGGTIDFIQDNSNNISCRHRFVTTGDTVTSFGRTIEITYLTNKDVEFYNATNLQVGFKYSILSFGTPLGAEKINANLAYSIEDDLVTINKSNFYLLYNKKMNIVKGDVDERFYLSETIDMSTDHVIDLTSYLNVLGSGYVTTVALNAIPGMSYFIDKQVYLVSTSKTSKHSFYSCKFAVVNNGGNNLTTKVTALKTTGSRVLVYDESVTKIPLSAMVIVGYLTTEANFNAGLFTVTGSNTNHKQLIFVSYDQLSGKTSYCHYHTKATTVASTNFIISNNVDPRNLQNYRHIYSDNVTTIGMTINYVPGEGLYIHGPNVASSVYVLNCFMIIGENILSCLDFITPMSSSGVSNRKFKYQPTFGFTNCIDKTGGLNTTVSSTMSAILAMHGVFNKTQKGYLTTQQTVTKSTYVASIGDNANVRDVDTSGNADGYNISMTPSDPTTGFYYQNNITHVGDSYGSQYMFNLLINSGDYEPQIVLRDNISWPGTNGGQTDYTIGATTNSNGFQGLYTMHIDNNAAVVKNAYNPANLSIHNASFGMSSRNSSTTSTSCAFELYNNQLNASTMHSSTRWKNNVHLATIGNVVYTSGPTSYPKEVTVLDWKNNFGANYRVQLRETTNTVTPATHYLGNVNLIFPLMNTEISINDPLEFNYSFPESNVNTTAGNYNIAIDPLSISYTLVSNYFDQGLAIVNAYDFTSGAYDEGFAGWDNSWVHLSSEAVDYALANYTASGYQSMTPTEYDDFIRRFPIQGYSFKNINNLIDAGGGVYYFEDLQYSWTMLNELTASTFALSYTLQDLNYTLVSDIPISVLSLSYGFESSALSLENQIYISELNTSYDLVGGSFVLDNTLTIDALVLDYVFENNVLDSSYELNVGDISLSYSFQTYSYGIESLFPIDALSILYSFENSTFANEYELSIDSLLMSYSFEQLDYVLDNQIIIDELNVSYSFENISIDGDYVLQIPNDSFTYSFENLSIDLDYVISQNVQLYLSYTFEEPNFNENFVIQITNLDMSYGFATYDYVQHYEDAIIQIDLDYIFETFSFDLNSDIELTTLSFDYSFENSILESINELTASELVISYNFENINLDNHNDVTIDPLLLSYSFENTYFDSEGTVTITPVSLSYSFVNNYYDLDLEIQISELTISYSFVNNEILNHNDLSIDVLSFEYQLNQLNIELQSDILITNLVLNYDFINNVILNENDISISELNISYSFVDNVYDLNNELVIDVLSTQYNFVDNVIDVPAHRDFDIEPITLSYSFQTTNLSIADDIIVSIDVPLQIQYSINDDSDIISSIPIEIEIEDLILDYSFVNNIIDIPNPQYVEIYILTLTYGFETYVFDQHLDVQITDHLLTYKFKACYFATSDDTYVDYVEMNYDFETINIEFENTLVVGSLDLNYSFENLSTEHNLFMNIEPINLEYEYYDVLYFKNVIPDYKNIYYKINPNNKQYTMKIRK